MIILTMIKGSRILFSLYMSTEISSYYFRKQISKILIKNVNYKTLTTKNEIKFGDKYISKYRHFLRKQI